MYTLDFFNDWFISKNLIKNRDGEWYLAVASLAGTSNVSEVIKDGESCETNGLTKDMLSYDFQAPKYLLQIYIGGMYFFNVAEDQWDGTGVTVSLHLIQNSLAA
jgi:hypothetical protein